MAVVKRESGAWKTVTNKLKEEGISVSNEGELRRLLDTEKKNILNLSDCLSRRSKKLINAARMKLHEYSQNKRTVCL
jgi:hypothetical protein